MRYTTGQHQEHAFDFDLETGTKLGRSENGWGFLSQSKATNSSIEIRIQEREAFFGERRLSLPEELQKFNSWRVVPVWKHEIQTLPDWLKASSPASSAIGFDVSVACAKMVLRLWWSIGSHKRWAWLVPTTSSIRTDEQNRFYYGYSMMKKEGLPIVAQWIGYINASGCVFEQGLLMRLLMIGGYYVFDEQGRRMKRYPSFQMTCRWRTTEASQTRCGSICRLSGGCCCWALDRSPIAVEEPFRCRFTGEHFWCIRIVWTDRKTGRRGTSKVVLL